jgi:hypothetical protein
LLGWNTMDAVDTQALQASRDAALGLGATN